MPKDLHSALQTEQVSEASGGGVRFLLVRLQRGKTDIVYSLHAGLQTMTLSRVRTTDFLPTSDSLRAPVRLCGLVRALFWRWTVPSTWANSRGPSPMRGIRFRKAISRCHPGATPQAEAAPSCAGNPSCPRHEMMVRPASNLRYHRSNVVIARSPVWNALRCVPTRSRGLASDASWADASAGIVRAR